MTGSPNGAGSAPDALWVDGRLVDPAAPSISAADRGFTLGDGLFETLRIAGGSPVGLDAHLARLAEGCAVLGLPVPATALLREALAAVVAAAGSVDGAARITWTRGPGPRGLLPPKMPRPTLVVAVAGGAAPQGPVRLCVAATTRRNEHSPLSRVKSLNYLDNVIARAEAAAAGCDDAVLLNSAGRIAGASAATLFLRLGDRLVTPPPGEGALPGTARARILAVAGLAEEAPVNLSDLDAARAVILTNALSVRAAVSLQGRGGTRSLDRAEAAATADLLRRALRGAPQ